MPQKPEQAERWAKCLEASKLLTERNEFPCSKQHVYNALKDLKKQDYGVQQLIDNDEGTVNAFKQLCVSGKVYGYGDPKPVKVKKAAESLKDDQVIDSKTGEVLTKYDMMKITYWFVNKLGGVEVPCCC